MSNTQEKMTPDDFPLFKRGSIWGSAAAILVVVVISITSYITTTRLVEANKWSSHTLEVIAEIRAMESNFHATIADGRSYFITGDEELTPIIEQGIRDVTMRIQQMQRLTTENPGQQQRIKSLQDSVLERFDALKQNMDRRREKGFDAAIGNSHAKLNLRIADLFRGIEKAERELLQARELIARRSADESRVLLVVGNLAVFVLMAIALRRLGRESKNRLRLEERLRAAAEHAEAANIRLANLNAELESSNVSLENANKELESFSYSVSHDLRAPLRTIDGFSRIVMEEEGSKLSEGGLEYLNRVRAGAKQMGVLIDDLLAFSRLSRRDMSPQPIDMNAVVRQCFQDLAAQINERAIEIVVDPLPMAQGDSVLVKQAVFNLLSNAVKFTRPRPQAHIHVGSTPGRSPAEYFISDDGVGFDMQYAHKLFGVFQRLHREDEFEGTGVGLAIVQRVVNRHGGSIRVESTLNGGTTFWFTLSGQPIHDAATA
ncbi:MAG: CHASE3 domain-containing protein [Pyrinomonadaceae bacterium]|nr:CHASE3 domain-containing protein [Phycisphaerales bacterium]